MIKKAQFREDVSSAIKHSKHKTITPFGVVHDFPLERHVQTL